MNEDDFSLFQASKFGFDPTGGAAAPGAGNPAPDKFNYAALGLLLGATSALQGAIGSFYAAKSERYKLKSQQLSLEFQQSMSAINARNAEYQAQSILESGQQQISQYKMRAGAQKAAAEASLGARGVQAGVGSAAETMATADLVKEMDAITINANSVRQAEAARMQRVNIQNEGMMAGVSAQNLASTRRTIRPYVGAATSLLGSAGSIASSYAVAQNRGYYPSDI
jgi:hypothetical protein